MTAIDVRSLFYVGVFATLAVLGVVKILDMCAAWRETRQLRTERDASLDRQRERFQREQQLKAIVQGRR